MSWVYFVQCGTTRLIKIGTTADLQLRLAQLQTGSPTRLVIMAGMEGGQAEEQDMHRRFASLRSHGEWFYDGYHLLRLISGLEYCNPRYQDVPLWRDLDVLQFERRAGDERFILRVASPITDLAKYQESLRSRIMEAWGQYPEAPTTGDVCDLLGIDPSVLEIGWAA